MTRSLTSSRMSPPVAAVWDSGFVATAILVSRSSLLAALAAREPAGGLMVVCSYFQERRHLGTALVGGVDAAWVERADVRQLDQVGREPFDRHEPLFARLVQPWH